MGVRHCHRRAWDRRCLAHYVEPTLGRTYIGRTFCVVVMAGLGSMSGTLVAAIILGVAETIVLTLFGASWAPAISFAMLLGVLAVRPQGLFGRRS